MNSVFKPFEQYSKEELYNLWKAEFERANHLKTALEQEKAISDSWRMACEMAYNYKQDEIEAKDRIIQAYAEKEDQDERS